MLWFVGSMAFTPIALSLSNIILFCHEINTSIEAMTDLITREWRQEAKIAKDVSAGMMLLVATGAVLVASVIFIPRIFGAGQ